LEVVVKADDEDNYYELLGVPALQQLDAATVVALVVLAVKAAARPRMTESESSILASLWQIATFQHAAQLLEGGCQLLLLVLLAAIRVWPDVTSSAGDMFKRMIRFAGDTIGSTVLLELLTAALQAGKQQAFELLWGTAYQAKHGFDGADVGQLLRSASRCGKHMFMAIERLLCEHHAWGAVSLEDLLAA
jgi:hypothetical protein